MLVRLGLIFTDVTVFTAGATATIGNEEVLVVNKSAGSTTAVHLPPVAGTVNKGAGRTIWIKDGKGDAGTNNITISDPAGNTIDGAASLVLNTNYGKCCLMFNGTQWNQLS